MSLHTIIDFLEPICLQTLTEDEDFKDMQIGNHITAYQDALPNITNADLVLLGCGETRGSSVGVNDIVSPNNIRSALYQLYYWHPEIHIADLGNVKLGATLQDTYAALRAVISELVEQGKRVVIIGGTHDLTLAQYGVYEALNTSIEATCVDSRIDLNMDSVLPQDNFLMSMLTNTPNFVRQYNHIAFQSYFVHPEMLRTIDNLKFECFRLGKVREQIEEIEPVMRTTNLLSFDIAAIQSSYAPVNRCMPNGLQGDEACTLMQYAGMSSALRTIGIYGYLPQHDEHKRTALQIAQMIWYIVNGMAQTRAESSIEETENFNHFAMIFSDIQANFLQSKETRRWWMQLPNGKYIPCSEQDYTIAASNEVPERWLRAMERSV